MNKITTFRAALFIICTCLLACNGNTNIKEQEPAQADNIQEIADSLILFDEAEESLLADELFADFFYLFCSSPKYQLSRIAFPLACNIDSDTLLIWQSEWQSFNRFTEEEYYTSLYDIDDDIELSKDTAISNVSVSWLLIDDNYIEQYEFCRNQSRFMLTSCLKDEISNTPHASFLRFYAQFSSDSLYQAEHISFPLKLVTEDQGEMGGGSTSTISKSEWEDFISELPLPSSVITNIDYGQAAFSDNRKLLLVQGISNSLYLKYKFINRNHQWMLYEIDN